MLTLYVDKARSVLLFGLWTSFTLETVTKSLKEAVAVWLVEFSRATVTRSLKASVTGPACGNLQ